MQSQKPSPLGGCTHNAILLIIAMGIIAAMAVAASAQVLLISPQPALDPPVTELPKEPSVKKQYTPAEASVIVRCSNGKDVFQCSGTAIDEHTVLTCWHVLREGGALTVNGKPATVIRSDSKSDVALLKTEEALKPIKVAEKPLPAGEPCTAYGYEYDKAGTLYKFPAVVVQLNRYLGFPNQSIRGRDPVKSGRSGGGLFNEAGELVGVCSAADGSEGLYAGHAAIVALLKPSYPVIPDKSPKIDPSKYAAPNYSMPSNGCPGGVCAKPTGKQSLQVQSCPNGQCRTAPAVVKQPSLGKPIVRRGLFFRGR